MVSKRNKNNFFVILAENGNLANINQTNGLDKKGPLRIITEGAEFYREES